MCTHTFSPVAIAYPSDMGSLVIHSVGDTWMCVQWEKSSQPSDFPVEACHISWTLLGDGVSSKSQLVPAMKAAGSLERCFFNITSLTPSLNYRIAVRGISKRGLGPASELVREAALSPTPSPSSSGGGEDFLDSGLFIAVVCVGSVMVLCLLALSLVTTVCCYIWCRNRRYKSSHPNTRGGKLRCTMDWYV